MTVADAFRAQAEVCASMGSPFTARLYTLIADRLARGTPVADRVLSWPGDPRGRADALPLRLAGALHGLVIEGRDPGLAAAYPPHAADDAALWHAVAAALEAHAPYVLHRLDSPPQTNEPQRSAALAPGLLTVAAHTGLPLVTSELGASAGLNLSWDRFRYRFGDTAWGDPASAVRIAPDWHGPPPPLPDARVAERAGCDRAPPDPTRDDDRLRLLSFVWADQAARMARVAAAIDIARAHDVHVDRADAPAWLEERLATPCPGHAHAVYHSIFWQYLPPEAQARARAALDAAGARATADAPLAWLRMEGDGHEPGAAITLTLWPGDETRLLGRVDYHGAWVRWTGWTGVENH
jgi:hypothetical protein